MGGAHGSTMYLFMILTLEEEIGVFKAELQEGDYLWDGHVGPLMYGVVLWQSLLYYVYGWVH